MSKIVASNIVQRGNCVLALSRRHGLTLPGGKYDRRRDTTYQDCAARELEEETGLLATKLTLHFHAPSEQPGIYMYVFKTSVADYKAKSGIVWVTWDQFLDQTKYPAFFNVCPKP